MSILDQGKKSKFSPLKEKLTFKNPFNRTYASLTVSAPAAKEEQAQPVPATEKAEHANAAAKPVIPTGMWSKCGGCGTIVYADDLKTHLWVCPKCGHHFRLFSDKRVALTVDEGSFSEFGAGITGDNPLDFPGYEEKLAKARQTTGLPDALVLSLIHI